MVGLLLPGRGGLIRGPRAQFFHAQFVDCRSQELPRHLQRLRPPRVGEEVAARGEGWGCCSRFWAVPGLFQPVLRAGRYLVDGSVVNPVPVSPVVPWQT
jgi:hypothetical protein